MHNHPVDELAPRPRLLLVDDHDVVRVGTRALLADTFEVVGEADNAESAIELFSERRPDIVLLDVRLPGGGGTFVAEQIRLIDSEACIVAFTVSVERDEVRAMLKAGVNGYLVKNTQKEQLADLLLSALDGAKPVSKHVAGHLLDIDEDIAESSDMSKLTRKERQVVGRIARGETYREAASKLEISPKTLESHMSHIFKKLGVASRHQLAQRMGPGFNAPDLDT